MVEMNPQYLGYLSQVICNESETEQEFDLFYKTLETLFETGGNVESEFLTATLNYLVEIGDIDTYIWFKEEIELNTSLAYKNINGKEMACLLFAIPVALSAGASFNKVCQDSEAFKGVIESLEHYEIVSESASFGLVPALFSHEELETLNPGAFKRMTEDLADEVLKGQQELSIPSCITFDQEMAICEQTPYSNIGYILGVACIAESELEDLFPPPNDVSKRLDTLDEVEIDDKGIASASDSQEEDSPEEDWTAEFCSAVDDAFGFIVPCESCLAPDGIYEDFRRGLSLVRDLNLTIAIETFKGLLGSNLEVSVSPTKEDEVFEIYIVDRNKNQVAETVSWPIYNFESKSSSVEELLSCLELCGVDTDEMEQYGLSPVEVLTLH